MMDAQAIQAQIDKEQAIARKAQEEKQKEDEARFIEERDALMGVGVTCEILGINVELKFPIQSYAWMEINGFHEADTTKQGLLLLQGATLHDDRIDWPTLAKNGYAGSEELLEAVKKAFELSVPLEPLTPVDERTQRLARNKPKPGGFKMDYAAMLLFVARRFGWTEEQFWTMTPRGLSVMMDKYSMSEYERAEEEKYQMRKNRRR